MIDRTSLSDLQARVLTLERELATRERWRGTYVPGLVYVPNDVVIYNNEIYLATKQNFNIAPGSTSAWTLLSSYNRYNYAFNGDFSLGGAGAFASGPEAMGTLYTQFTPGWGCAKQNGGDTLLITLVDPADDVAFGTLNAAELIRTSGTGWGHLYAFPGMRIRRRLTAKPFTISTRVNCTSVGLSRIRYTDSAGVDTFGVPNVQGGGWETISLTIPASDLAGGNTPSWGVELMAGSQPNTAAVYVQNFSVVEGIYPLPGIWELPPNNAGSLWSGAQKSKAPRCIKYMPVGGFLNVTSAATATVPFSLTDFESEYGMGSGNGIVIRTDGTYLITGELLCSAASAPATFYVYPSRASALPGVDIWDRFAANAFPLYARYTAGGPYVTGDFCIPVDLVEGDVVTMNAAVTTVGPTVTFHYSDSFLAAHWIGD